MVKCVDCGYLSRHSPLEVEFHEIPTLERQVGPDPQAIPGVACFRAKVNYLSECFKEGEEEFAIDFFEGTISQKRDVMRWVINKERDCGGFYSYAQGHSPKEHLSIQRGQEWQERMANEQREWQESMATKQQEWQERMGSKTLHWGLITMGVILVLATLAAPFLASLFSD